MIVFYIICVCICSFVISLIVEWWATEKIAKGLTKKYVIRQDEKGFFLETKYLWVKGLPEEFQEARFQTEKIAEEKLQKFLRAKLISSDKKKFCKIVKVSDIRADLEVELAEKNLREIFASQEVSRAKEIELIKEMQRVNKSKTPENVDKTSKRDTLLA